MNGMPGTLVYVMGPSGAGKDSLIASARNRLNNPYRLTWDAAVHARRALRPVFFVRRHITRPARAGGERHQGLTHEEFQSRQRKGAFALSWESHGLHYGIGVEIDAHLAREAVVVVNGSREYLMAALAKYPALVPVLISVRPEALRARLEKRGRESAADIRARLARADMPVPEISGLIQVDNSGPPEEGERLFWDMLLRLRSARPQAGKSAEIG